MLGSPPSRWTALRIAARSTTSGTPVKSCRTMRATTKGISSFAGDFAFQLASVSTSLRPTFFPSQFRRTDSKTMRMLTGKRETGPTPCSSSAGRKCRNDSCPFPASNFFSVLNSLGILGSLELGEPGFDFVEIGQLARVVVHFRVLNDAVAIDEEGRALGHAGEAEIELGQKGVVSDAVTLRHLM